MIPAKLTIQNFLSYRDAQTIDFAGIHVACLCGDNGHGKTAILDAWTWALWGETRARTEDEVVHVGETEATVDFEFLVDDTRYRVTRQRRRAHAGRPGISILQLFVQEAGEWRPLSGDTMRDTQARIEEIVHIDYDTFINSAFLVQGRADEFVRKTPGQRKEILGTILGLEHYDLLATRARDGARGAEAQRFTLAGQIVALDDEIGRRAELEESLAATQERLEDLETALAAQQEALDALKATVQDASHRKDLLANANEQLRQANVELRRSDQAVAQHETRIKQYETAIANAQAINTGSLLEQERQSLATAQLTRGRWQSQFLSLKQQVADITADLESQADPAVAIAQKQRELAHLQATERDLRQDVGATAGQLARLADLEATRPAKVAAFNEAASMKAILSDLAQAFGKNGVPALIIDSVLPEIEAEANRLLAKMTDGRMALSITTQRETQKGSTVETLDIRVADELATRAYESYSGGEAFRINLALRIALSRLLAHRAGAPLPTLVIDEGFGTQDVNGRDRIIEALRAIQDDFRCLLVITHVPELQDAFPVRIRVTKTSDGSTISVEGRERPVA